MSDVFHWYEDTFLNPEPAMRTTVSLFLQDEARFHSSGSVASVAVGTIAIWVENSRQADELVWAFGELANWHRMREAAAAAEDEDAYLEALSTASEGAP